MKTQEEARELANIMKDIGILSGKKTICVLTNMDEPVGKNVGNSLEIIEAVECLKGNMEEDIKEIVLTLGSHIIKLAGFGDNIEENKDKIIQNIKNGKAYDKFLELVEAQGGDIEYIKNTELFEKSKYIIPVISEDSGYVDSLNGEKVGLISVNLGAGRMKKEDNIDKAVGIIINKKISDKVEPGEVLAYIYANDKEKGQKAVNDLKEVYTIVSCKVNKPEHILGIID
jgi:pyrimidine-nucleoside phosphorylase